MTPAAAIAVGGTVLLCAAASVTARRLRLPAAVGWLPAAMAVAFGWRTVAQAFPTVTDPADLQAMGVLAHLGLVLAVCEAGRHARLALGRAGPVGLRISPGSLLVHVVGPPAIALPLVWAGARVTGVHQPPQTLAFLTVALSVTAVPVLTPIVADLPKRFRTNGVRALAVAVATDALAWSALVVLIAATSSGPAFPVVAVGTALVAGTCVLTGVLIRRLPTALLAPVVLAGLLAAAAGSDLAGWHAGVGAAAFGVSLPRDGRVDALFRRLQPLVNATLLPLVVVVAVAAAPAVPLAQLHVPYAAALLVTAVLCKAVPALLLAIRSGDDVAETAVFAALVNVRGATEIVVAAIGMEALGVPGQVGLTLAIIAMVSTVAIGPALILARRLAVRRLGPHQPTPTDLRAFRAATLESPPARPSRREERRGNGGTRAA